MSDDNEDADPNRRDRDEVPESVRETFQGEELTKPGRDADSGSDRVDEDSTMTLNVDAMGLDSFEDTDVEEIPHIVVVAGPEVGEIIPMEESRLVFGRSEEADVQIHDPAVSRSHAAVDASGDVVVVEDLNSSNGTFVEGQPVADSRELRNGDKIRVGSTTLLKFTRRQLIEDGTEGSADVYESAFYDDLTGALNKEGVLESLDSQLEFAAQADSDLAVVLLDLDHFKAINDEYGHLAGDAILKQLGELVDANTRSTDVFGRFGGEEFILLCRDMGLEEGREFGERLRRTVADHEFHYEGTAIDVTTSIGITAVHPTDESADEVVERADRALYRAKEQGRNRTEIARP